MNALSDEVRPDSRGVSGPVVDGLGTLVLARLAVPGGATRAEIVRDLSPLVSHRLSPAEWRAKAAETASALLAGGIASETRGRLSLTDAGREVARAVLGSRAQPPTPWVDMRDLRLVALALGMVGEGTAKLKALATPDGLRAAILQKAFGLPRKGNQTANRLRVELAVVALERAFGNKIKSGLGASGGFTAKAGRLLAGQLAARPRDFGTDGRLIAELAAEQVSAPQTDPEALRLAVLRRWVSSVITDRVQAAPAHRTDKMPLPVRAHPLHETRADAVHPAANDTEPASLGKVPTERPDLEAFVREVRSATDRVADGWPGNRKAFISRVWQEIRTAWPQWNLSEIEFKCMLAEAHRSGRIGLAGADLKDRRSLAEVEASAVAYKNAVWHYVRVED